MEPTVYRICVRGQLTQWLATAFDGMTLEPGVAHTALIGQVRDQSQLFGLLDRVRDLGLELVSVRPRSESP